MNIQRIDFLGLPLDLGLTLSGVCELLHQKDEARLVAYISPSSWAVARKYPDYLEAMRKMSVIRAGGEGVVRVARLLTNAECPRINFDMTSMADPFFKLAAFSHANVMLVGGEPGVAERVEEKLHDAYPQMKIIGTEHGYGELTDKTAAVLKLSPDIVIAAMGSPRQELFLLALKDAGYRGMAITCGGFFDQYLEDTDYYPHWVNKWNLRFAYRLFKEPRRLWRRYLIDYQIFVWLATKALFEKWQPRILKRETP